MSYDCIDGYVDLIQGFRDHGLVTLPDPDTEDNQGEETRLCLESLALLVGAARCALVLLEDPDAGPDEATLATQRLRSALGTAANPASGPREDRP